MIRHTRSAKPLATKKSEQDANRLCTEFEDLTADTAQLTLDAADLAQALNELVEAMVQQTEERTATKAKRHRRRSKQLRSHQDFDAQAAQATAFAQQSGPADDAPETFGKPYQGMGGSGGNIVISRKSFSPIMHAWGGDCRVRGRRAGRLREIHV